jgi:hypothetical protein
LTLPRLYLTTWRDKNNEFSARRIERVLIEGQSLGEASDNLPIYSLNESDFFAHLRETDDDLLEQISRFQFGLDQWFKFGEPHPPYFPWRIIIILSKRGEKDRENLFMASYCRHFHDRARRGSRTDEKIVERAIKKKAWDYW